LIFFIEWKFNLDTFCSSTIKYDLFIILLPGYELTLGKTMIDSTSAQLICGPHNVVSINAVFTAGFPMVVVVRHLEHA